MVSIAHIFGREEHQLNEGTLAILVEAIAPKHERLLSGMVSLGHQLLWVCPGSQWDDLAQQFNLDLAFPELRAITWQMTFRFHESPFGNSQALGPEINDLWESDPVVIMSADFAFPLERLDWHDRVAWAPAHWPQLWRWLLRSDRELSYIPDTAEAAARWARVVEGFAWLNLVHPASEPEPSIEADPIVRSYIRATMKIGGVAGVMWSADTYSGVVFLGDSSILQRAASVLLDQGGRVAKEELDFDRLWERGLYLRALY
jgi:hypothetical protein